MRQRKQMGCVVKKGGWWVLRHRERVKVGGKLRTVLRSRRLTPVDSHHKTKASVRGLAEETLKPVNDRKIAPEMITTLGDFVEHHYLPYVETHMRPSTLKGYRDNWHYHLEARCKTAWLRDVRTCHVQRWMDTVAQEDNLSKASLKHIKHLLSGVFNHAKRQGFFDGANPVQGVAIPAGKPSSETYAYSLEEVERMLKLLPEPAGTAVAVAAFTGLRLGEIRGLQWDDYSPGTEESMAMLRVCRSIWGKHVSDPKTAKSKAPVPVIAPLAQRLESYRSTCAETVKGPIFCNSFGRPLSLDGIYQRVMKGIFKAAKVQWHGWHAFRRGLATNLHRLGVDDKTIQAILRHSNVATTQNVYIKTLAVDAVAAMKRFEALTFPKRSPITAESDHVAVN